MENETIEVVKTSEYATTFKNEAIKAATGAIIGVIITELAMFLMHKAAKKFRKTPTVVEVIEK